jgi:DivIVA domain-containing protein
MYQNKIKLTTQEILDKSFKIDTRGYRPKEVDQFLDEIIADYDQFYRIINSIEREKNELIAENMHLKQELRNAKMNIEIVKRSDAPEVTNVDIMRRLARLEKLVYGDDKKERVTYNSSKYEESNEETNYDGE